MHQHHFPSIKTVRFDVLTSTLRATTVEVSPQAEGRRHRHSVSGETYHKAGNCTSKLPAGRKHDYDYHTEAMDRAVDGGIDDVGLGVLFGLEMCKYEFAGLLMHASIWAQLAHGVGPHTISVPRIKRAE